MYSNTFKVGDSFGNTEMKTLLWDFYVVLWKGDLP
jgi:hypothetical protein